MNSSLSLIFHFEDLRGSDLTDAASMYWPDFEDALQAVTAGRLGADYIITRKVKDFINRCPGSTMAGVCQGHTLRRSAAGGRGFAGTA